MVAGSSSNEPPNQDTPMDADGQEPPAKKARAEDSSSSTSSSSESESRPIGDLAAQIAATMRELDAVDVMEFYSPPRVCPVAAKMRLRAGSSLDLATVNSKGEKWDFARADHRDEARQRYAAEEPMLPQPSTSASSGTASTWAAVKTTGAKETGCGSERICAADAALR